MSDTKSNEPETPAAVAGAARGSAYRTWYIKVAYTFGEPRTIGHTVRARNQKEAERKAAKIVQGKCVGFAVYTPNADISDRR